MSNEQAEEEVRDKRVEFYAANVEAWFNSRLEFDKSLLTLSSAGIGLLITLLSTLGIRSETTLLLYEAAVVAFLICLGAVLWAMRRNSSHLEAVNRGEDGPDSLLGALDNIAVGSFFIGVVFSAGLGITAATHSLLKKEEDNMKDFNQPQPQVQIETLGKSANGAAAMKPVAAPAQSTQPPPASPAVTPSTPSASPKGAGQKK